MVRAVRIHLFIGGILLVAAINVFPQTNDTIPSSKPKYILLNEITVVGNRTFHSNPFDKQELDMENMYNQSQRQIQYQQKKIPSSFGCRISQKITQNLMRLPCLKLVGCFYS